MVKVERALPVERRANVVPSIDPAVSAEEAGDRSAVVPLAVDHPAADHQADALAEAVVDDSEEIVAIAEEIGVSVANEVLKEAAVSVEIAEEIAVSAEKGVVALEVVAALAATEVASVVADLAAIDADLEDLGENFLVARENAPTVENVILVKAVDFLTVLVAIALGDQVVGRVVVAQAADVALEEAAMAKDEAAAEIAVAFVENDQEASVAAGHAGKALAVDSVEALAALADPVQTETVRGKVDRVATRSKVAAARNLLSS